MSVRVRYRGESTWPATACLVAVWRRGDIPCQIMSASSGPKDYLRNAIWALFDQDRELERVAMLVARGTPFVLRSKGGAWYDCTNHEVVAEGGGL